MDLMERMQSRVPPLIKLLGVELTEVTTDRIVGELVARPELGNGIAILHGGAYMSFGDFLGALGTLANLPKGFNTTTIESKTNFFAAAPIGSKLIGVSTPLHRGRTTQVWQTRISNPEGKLLALVTQTQMVLAPRPKADEAKPAV